MKLHAGMNCVFFNFIFFGSMPAWKLACNTCLRWVITQKTIDDNQVVKARLVARGFEEDTSDIRTDSPTVSKENIRLMSTIAVANSWNVHSIDVRLAFLQGFEIERELFVVPPPEAASDGMLLEHGT